jgi:bifunctional non-homologous end joining protein LigD
LGPSIGKPAILDGEIVALKDNGHVSFEELQARMNLASERVIQSQVGKLRIIYMVFDVLYLDGRSLMRLPYTGRRLALERLRLRGPNWQTPPYHRAAGPSMLQAARQNHLEGVMAKRLDSTYEPGERSGDWLKIKFTHRQEFVIGGYQLT